MAEAKTFLNLEQVPFAEEIIIYHLCYISQKTYNYEWRTLGLFS